LTRDVSKLIEAVNRVGIQNVSLLARMTGIPTETIRYTVKTRFSNMGLNVRTPVNHSALGLERYFVSLRLTEDAAQSQSAVLRALNSDAFLTYRCEAPIERRHLLLFSVPVSLVDEFRAFLDRLAAERVIADYSSQSLEWSRHPELKSKFYDFGRGEWSVDWEEIKKSREAPPEPSNGAEPSASPEIDSTDTLIIKELELDSWRNITEIARKLGLNERTVRWHYRKHVGNLGDSSYVSWNPVTKERLKQAVGFVHEFEALPQKSVARLRLLFNNFPFSWFEGGRKDGYYQVHSALPAGYFMDSLRFLNAELAEIVETWKAWTIDLSTVHAYTIPYQNFDREKGWFFNSDAALKAVLPQKMKIG
jgi:hypothetical protein